MKFARKLSNLSGALYVALAMFISGTVQATSFTMQDNYNSTANWTFVGTNVVITGGMLRYINNCPDGSEQRAYRSLTGNAIDQEDPFRVEIDFNPSSVGGSTGSPYTGHNILALTAGTLEPISNCNNPNNCTTHTNQDQDGIMVNYITTNPTDGNIYFRIIAKDGTGEIQSAFTAAVNTVPNSYRVILERICASTIDLIIETPSGAFVTGTTLTLPAETAISGLNTLQHGNVARGFSTRQLEGTIDNLNMDWTDMSTEPDDYCDLYNTSDWTQVGVNVQVANNQVEYINGAADATRRAVYRTIPNSAVIDANTTFIASFNFHPQSVGNSGGPMTGHNLLALTAGNEEPISECNGTGPCVNPNDQDQDGVMVLYITRNPSDQHIYFRIVVKDGLTEIPSDFTAPVDALPNDLHVVLQRNCVNNYSLGIYELNGSTVGNLITSTFLETPGAQVDGLDHIQHANVARGFSARQLTGTIDGLCMAWDVPTTPPNVWSHESSDNLINSTLPLPTVNTGVSISPEASGSTFFKNTAIVWDSPVTNSYEIHWYADNLNLHDQDSREGVDPDVAFYANPDGLHVAKEWNGSIYVDEYALNSGTGGYDFLFQGYVDDGSYPNIHVNSNGDGILCWENGGEVYIQPILFSTTSPLFLGIKELVGPGTQPDVVLSDNGTDVTVTYIQGGDLEIRQYDYSTMWSPFGPPQLTASYSQGANGDPYAYPRIATPQNANFYNAYGDYTVVAERNTSTGDRIEAFTGQGGSVTNYLVNGGFETCNNGFPVVTYNMETLVFAWSTEYSGCANTLNIQDTPPQEDVIITEYDPGNLVPLNNGDFFEVNSTQNGFQTCRPAIAATFDGNYSVAANDAREAIVYYNNNNIYWKKRSWGGYYKHGDDEQVSEGLNEDVLVRMIQNPVKEMITLEGMDLRGAQISMYDMSGRLISLQARTTGSDQRTEIDVRDLSPGMYLLSFELRGDQVSFKVVKE